MSTATIPAWRARIAELRYLAAKVGRVHGGSHPAMATLAEAVATLADSAPADRLAHAALGRRLAELTGGFRPWGGACASVHQLFAGLQEVAAALPAAPEQP